MKMNYTAPQGRPRVLPVAAEVTIGRGRALVALALRESDRVGSNAILFLALRLNAAVVVDRHFAGEPSDLESHFPPCPEAQGPHVGILHRAG
jgi:hypothetical protein